MRLDKRLVFRKSFVRKFGKVLLVLFLGMLLLFCYRMFPKTEYRTDDVVTVLKDNKHYSMHLSYPISHHRKVDSEIKKYIKDEMDQFLDTVDKDQKQKQRLEITYRMYTYQSVKTILFTSQAKVTSLHYDDKNGTLLSYSDFLNTDQKSFGKIKQTIKSMLLQELFRQQISVDQEKVNQKLEKLELSELQFVFHENGVTFFFGKEFLKGINEPIQITLSYAKMWSYIQTKQVRKEDRPTEEELEYVKIGLPDVEGKKLVALTFDDGPNYNTSKILEILNEYNVSATFFVLGSKILGNEKIIKMMDEYGMEIGNHTYSHKLMIKMDSEHIIKEIKDTNDLIYKVINRYPKVVRPSYGSFNKKIKESIDMPIIIWDIDTLDWKNHNSTKIVSRVINKVSDGDIILMHDIYSATVKAVDIVIPKLINEGYQIVSVSELFYYKNIKLENGKVYGKAG